jgi:Na+/proline symporter
MPLTLVFCYLLITIAIGLWAAKRVKNTADSPSPAGTCAGDDRTTTFATWFGAETVLGIPRDLCKAG